MEKEQKIRLMRILTSFVLMLAAMFLPTEGLVRLLTFLIPYGITGWDVLFSAGRNILHGEIFNENFLMCIATLGAFGIGEYPEGVAVMIFFQVGELFQDCAVDKSRRSITELMDIRPDSANLIRDGKVIRVNPETVMPGDCIEVRPGEKIPLDGVILTGEALLNTAALTGESLPRSVGTGDSVVSGVIDTNGVLTVRVTKAYADSTVAQILNLVENASGKKAKAENFITAFAKVYTPVVVCLAVALATLPPLFGLGLFRTWIYRSLTFLVVSCPCALVVSVPLGFFGGIGGASRNGILIKGGNYLEMLSRVKTVVFDKTGTLTTGVLSVTGVFPSSGITEETLLRKAAGAECLSTHPVSRAVAAACGERDRLVKPTEVTESAGLGVRAILDGKIVVAGNAKWMEHEGISFAPCAQSGTLVYVAEEGQYLGCIAVADTPKKESAVAIRELRQAGVGKIVMLTGDNRSAGEDTAKALSLNEVYSELLPEDKVEKMEELTAQKPPKSALAFVGDGINDAPSLRMADVGIAMGALGSDAAVEAADIVLMDDNPQKIAAAVRIAKKTLRIVRQNVVFALTTKAVVLLLTAFGIGTMWAAVFADVGVLILAVLNSARALRLRG